MNDGPAPAPFPGSSRDYRARSDRLLEAAAHAESAEAATALQAEALEWRKLAIEADWQEAMQAALEAQTTGSGAPGAADPEREDP